MNFHVKQFNGESTYLKIMVAKPSGIKVLIAIELFIAALGIASGVGLISDPSEKGMGLDGVKVGSRFRACPSSASGS